MNSRGSPIAISSVGGGGAASVAAVRYRIREEVENGFAKIHAR
jgi:hypothetical protein